MWTVWKEFEDIERSMMVVKQTFLKSLYEWMVLLSSHSFSSILDFIDCYNFSLFGVIQMRFGLLVKLGVLVLV